jgi:hypothetical protein
MMSMSMVLDRLGRTRETSMTRHKIKPSADSAAVSSSPLCLAVENLLLPSWQRDMHQHECCRNISTQTGLKHRHKNSEIILKKKTGQSLFCTNPPTPRLRPNAGEFLTKPIYRAATPTF